MAEETQIILTRIDETLKSLVQSHRELKSEIKPVIEDVQRIKIHLYADNFTGSSGLIKTVAEHSTKIEVLENNQMNDKKAMALWGGTFGVIGGALIKLITWLFFR